MLKNVYLHGYLGEQFGKKHRLDVENAQEALKALQTNYPDFRSSIKKDGEYGIYLGDSLEDGIQIGAEELELRASDKDIHVVPLLEGSSGWVRVILGVVLIVAAIWVPALQPIAWKVGFAGASLILQGVSQLMAPSPDPMGGLSSSSGMSAAQSYIKQERPEERPSYLFTGPTNTTEQGGVIPICYGKFWTGSITISAGLKIV